MMRWIGGIVFTSFLVIYGIFSFMAYTQITGEEKNIAEILKNYIRNEEKSIYNTLDLTLESVIQNRNIQQTFAKRDRGSLLSVLLPLYKSAGMKGISQFQFHIPPAESFLRLHKPEMFGDDLSDLRPMLKDAIQKQAMLTGLEYGKAGIGMRVIKPVYYNNMFIGTVEMGGDLGLLFLKSIKNFYPGRYTLYKISGDKPEFLFSTDSDTSYVMKTDTDIPRLLKHEDISTDCGAIHIIKIPLLDYYNKTIAYIVCENDRTAAQIKIKKTMIITFTIMLLMFGAVILFIIYFYRKIIIIPIAIIHSFLARMSDNGDFGSSINITGDDEINDLYKYLNFFSEKLGIIFDEVKKSTEQISKTSVELTDISGAFAIQSQNLAASTEEISCTIEEISNGSESIANETSVQSDEISVMEKKLNALNSDISEIERQIGDTSDISSEINIITGSSGRSLKSMSENMGRISSSSEEMKNIVNIINEISDKINLLSLNAAIEAARAGESGRGFAVVADEISKLAELTAKSIKDIDLRITENKTEIGKFSLNVEEVLNFLDSIISGIGSISQMSGNIKQAINSVLEENNSISDGFIKVKKRSDNISIATSEQKNAMLQISETISEIVTTTQSIASESEEIILSSEKLSSISGTLDAKMTFFKTK